MSKRKSLKPGDIALITGAASGIGLALARDLARRGVTVVATDRDLDAVVKVSREIGAHPMALDVTDAQQFAEVAEKVRQQFGRIDILFNNAGISVAGEGRDFALSDWDTVIDVNLRGVIHGVQAVYPHMLRRGQGHIVNVSSAAGLFPMPMMASYTASKHAVVGLSRALRAEAHDLGVAVSVVCPGVVQTNIQSKTKVVNYDPAVSQSKHATRALSPEQCARIILKGVERNQETIIVTRLAKLLSAAYRVSPAAFNLVVRRQLREIRKFRLPTSHTEGK